MKVSGEMATMLERKERKTSVATDHHVFGLVEGEEDKRE